MVLQGPVVPAPAPIPSSPAPSTLPHKVTAPSPPPKPSALSSPVPPRKPISLAAAAIATIAANQSSTPPIPAPRLATAATHAHTHSHTGSIGNNSLASISTSPNAPPPLPASAPGSSLSSPVSTHSPLFTHGGPAPSPQPPQPPYSPAMASNLPHHRSQTIPVSPQVRPSSSSTFLTAAASSIAAKQQQLFRQQHQDNDQDPSEASNPFEDPSDVVELTPAISATSASPSPVVASSPSFAPRAHNQSLLTARLQAMPPSPSSPMLHAPVPQYGPHATGSRVAVSSPPPPPVQSAPSLPPRSRSPLASLSLSSPQQPIGQGSLPAPTPTRQNSFSPSNRHSSVHPPTHPHAQSLAMSLPSQPVPPPPRRASIQMTHSTSPQPPPRGPSPLFASPGEAGMAGNAARFRNLTTPHQAYDGISSQTPKRVFSSSTGGASVGAAAGTAAYNRATSPVPEHGIATMDLSDSQSDLDETSDDSDRDYDDVDEENANPFMHTTNRNRHDHRAECGPCPAARRRPQFPPDSGSLLSLNQLGSQDSYLRQQQQQQQQLQQQQQAISGPSEADGVFPDYSRSNRRQPLFQDVIDIHDIHQKSHGVRSFSISNEQVATATSNIRVYSLTTGENTSSYGHVKDTKPTVLMFTQSRRPEALGQYLWAGWSEGSLQVIDTRTKEVIEKKRAAHRSGTVTHIIRFKSQVWTVDDGGTVCVWPEEPMMGRPTLQNQIQSLTIPAKQFCAIAVQDMLWSSDGSRIHVIRVGPDAGRPKLPPTTIDIPYGVGPLTCMATIAGSGQVFTGHEDGKVIVWSIDSREKLRIINVHAYRIMSLLGVGSYLWAGFATGKIYVLDLRPEVPVVMKDWQAHKDSGVSMLQLDEEGLIVGSRHQVGSCAENGEVKVWDGLMAKDRLTKGMVDRSKEYCRWRDLKVLICSWNIDSSKPAAQDANSGADKRMFESWLMGMDQEGPPDIISVGFQEIVDLESKKMTAKSILKGSKKAESETISKQYKRWQIYLTNKIRELYSPMGVNYKLLECSNLVGLFSCVFVKSQELVNIRSEWTHVDMVKTGLKGYHGNKGGIATRFIIDDTSISFVNCHLAAGQSHTRQRNTDAANVLRKLCHPNPAVSTAVHPEVFWFGDGTLALDHEICFLSGDLNYRIDVKFSEAVHKIQAQDWEYLHQHDQLLQQKLRNPQFVLRIFNESELLFAPTYKYDPGTDTYDTSSKHRTPAWCDRILWRGRHVRQLFYKRNECRVSDHKPISGGFIIGVKKIDEAQRQIVEQQVMDGWYKVQEREIRIRKLAWLRSWGWTDARVEGILDREGGDLGKVVSILSE
ncbi:hypothetical protein BGW38_002523 [Lunasporangiospora selenospora]|uniref:Inositol polyphosphate-related phosphatase domain-containing protein n=1 Tax=Lunasporangiospora selenospora TaxID=979761 RepID=A0A9P6FSQ9_9FUNG|nr:hypothetical protein BGW38_002523 [Lunasporangiospora selenospora]